MKFETGDLVKPNGPWLDETARVVRTDEQSDPELALVEDRNGKQEWIRTEFADLA